MDAAVRRDGAGARVLIMITRLARLLSAVRRLWAPDRADRALDDEMRACIDLLAAEYEAAGVRHEEALRRARIEIGGVESVKQSVRDVRAGAGLERTVADVRYAVRALYRTPAFTLAAVLTLGVGIGINTSVFTVLNAVLLAPLPYERPEELLNIGHRMRAGTAMESIAIGITSRERALWRGETTLFQGAEVYRRGMPMAWRERGESLSVGAFTAGLPSLLGVAPRLGRVFSAPEVETRVPVVVISDTFWARAFDRSDSVLGTDITLAGVKMTIIGVMPASFRYGPGGNGSIDAWTGYLEGKDSPANTESVFRLRTGLTSESAQPLADATARRIQDAQPSAEPWTPVLYPMGVDRAIVRERQTTVFMLLLAATTLVLLVACANLANLFAARNTSRRHELAIRAALGATRSRLAALILCEGMVVTFLGGVIALLFAIWTLDVVVATMPVRMSAGLFAVSAPGLDWRVLAFTAGLATVAALLTGLWPAMRNSQVTFTQALGDTGKGAGISRDRQRLSAALQAFQVALALVLVTAAGFFGSSLYKMLTVDVGFDPHGLMTVSIELPAGPFATAEAQRLGASEALSILRAVPGVRLAALGSSPPSANSGRFVRSGATEATGSLALRSADDTYFRTTGIPVKAGRGFSPDDTHASTPVAVIDEAGAAALFPGESPVGQRFSYSPYVPELTIVGVVGNVAASDFNTKNLRSGMYLAASQESSRHHTFVFRANGDEALVLNAVRTALEAWQPQIQVIRAGSVSAQYERLGTFATPRLVSTLVGLFAAMALVTAAVGVYGMLAYAVGQRSREIGVRLALGSSSRGIRRLVIIDALKPVVIGLIVGGVAVWMSSTLLEGFLFNVGTRDPIVLVGSVAVLVAASLLSTVGPIRRALRVDPIQALKAE